METEPDLLASARQFQNSVSPMAKISITRDKFLETLRKSELVIENEFDEIIKRYADEVDPGRIARKLIGEGVVTRWQAKMLLTGRSKLKLGKYVLLDLLARDSLGDRFSAHHSSLDRKVELQILPAALAENPEDFATFIQQAQQASTLDHPHLIHVYDIDKESGRYYLVLEHVEGQPASEIGLDELADTDVGLLTEQALSGIRAAHEKDIVHGQLTLQKLLLHKNDDLRITDISVSTLRRQLDESQDSQRVVSPEGDFRDIGKACIELIKRCKRGSAAPALLELLTRLTRIDKASAVEPIQNSIHAWVQQNASPVENIFDDSTDDSIDGLDVPTSPSERVPVLRDSISETAASGASKQPAKNSKVTGNTNSKHKKTTPSKKRSKTLPSARKPATGLLVAVGGAAAALLLVAGYFIFNWLNSDSGSVSDAESNQPKISTRFDIRDDLDKADNEKKNNTDSRKSTEKTTHTGNFKKDETTAKKDDGKKNELDSQDASQAQPENPKAGFDDDGFPIKPADQELTDAVPGGSEEDSSESWPGAMLNSDGELVNDTEQTVEYVRNAFDGFPAALELPEVVVTEAQVQPLIVAQLFPKNGFVDSINLINDPAEPCLGSQLSIRNAGAEQKWIVSFENEAGDSIDVGEFTFAEGVLTFGWLATAQENLDCNYLRNCRLRVAADGTERTAYLRQPVALDALTLDKKKYNTSITVDIPWMPPAEFISLETQTSSIPDFPEVFFENDKRALGGDVKDGALRIAFDEQAANRFLWLNLRPEYRRGNKFRLEAEVTYQPLVPRQMDQNIYFYVPDFDLANAIPYRPKTYSTMIEEVSNFRKAIGDLYADRKQKYDSRVIENDRRNYNNLNTKISDAITQTDAFLEALDIQKSVVDELTENAIPFRLMFKFADGDAIEIARTSKANGGSPPVVDLNLSDNAKTVKNVLKNSGLEGIKGEFADWEFDFTRGGSNNTRFVLERSTNEVSIEIYDGTGSFFQTGLDQSNFGGSSFGTAQVKFQIGWNEKSDRTNSSTINLSVAGTDVFQLTTPDGNGVGPITPQALNAAQIKVEQDGIPKQTLQTVVVELPRTIENIDEVRFTWQTGNDDFKIDNVELLVEPESGFVSTFAKGKPAALVHESCLITDNDSNNLQSAKVVLTNPKEGDHFVMGDKVMVIDSEQTIPGSSLKYLITANEGNVTIDLIGNGPIVQYLFALKSIKFDSNAESPSRDDRYIDITLNDGTSDSAAVSTLIAIE